MYTQSGLPYRTHVPVSYTIVAVYKWSVGTPKKRGLLRKFKYIIKKDGFFLRNIFIWCLEVHFFNLWTSNKKVLKKKNPFFMMYLTPRFWVGCQPTKGGGLYALVNHLGCFLLPHVLEEGVILSVLCVFVCLSACTVPTQWHFLPLFLPLDSNEVQHAAIFYIFVYKGVKCEWSFQIMTDRQVVILGDPLCLVHDNIVTCRVNGRLQQLSLICPSAINQANHGRLFPAVLITIPSIP